MVDHRCASEVPMSGHRSLSSGHSSRHSAMCETMLHDRRAAVAPRQAMYTMASSTPTVGAATDRTAIAHTSCDHETAMSRNASAPLPPVLYQQVEADHDVALVEAQP